MIDPAAEPVRPQRLRNAVRAAGLPRAEICMINALINRANWKTWRVDGPDLSSVRQLGDEFDYSRRHARRGLRSAELRGLVRIEQRDWATNAYQIEVDAILELARKRKGKGRLRLAYGPEDLEQIAVPRRDAAHARPRPTAPGEPPAETEAEPEAPHLPDWLTRAAERYQRPAPELHAMVAGAARLVLGAEAAERAQLGTLARPVLRLWKAMERPSAPVFLADVELLVTALAEDCTEDALLHARGLRLVTPRGSRQGTTRIERFGQNLSHDLPRLLARSAWTARFEAAHRHAEGRCRCRRHAKPAAVATDQAPESGGLDVLLGADRPALALLETAAAARWEAASQALRARMDLQDWEIWIRALEVRGVRDGALVLEAPNRFFLTHVARTYGDALVAAVGGPIWLCRARPPNTS